MLLASRTIAGMILKGAERHWSLIVPDKGRFECHRAVVESTTTGETAETRHRVSCRRRIPSMQVAATGSMGDIRQCDDDEGQHSDHREISHKSDT